MADFALGQLREIARLDIEAVEMRTDGFEFGVLGQVGGEHQRFTVGRPGRIAEVVLALGELTRRAAVGGDDEQVPITRLEITGAVLAPVQLVDHLRRLSPVRALGFARQLGHRFFRRFDQHAESQAASIGRPRDTRGCRRQLRKPGRPARIQPQHLELRPAFAGAHEGNALAVRRDAWRKVAVRS